MMKDHVLVCAAAMGSVLALSLASGCTGDRDPIGSQTRAVGGGGGGGVKSQLRGYDLGPPFPAGFRDSGLVNGYAEGEWVPFVAVMEGTKLANADALAGASGDGQYRASIIVPTYSPRHDANAIMDLATTGTYGQGAVTPIPDPFDSNWLSDNGYWPLVLGAYADTGDVDTAPAIDGVAQRTGPTRFGGQVSSVEVPISFTAPASATRVELRFAVRLAVPGMQPIAPGEQGFPGSASGSALGAADFFPGPGPIFVGYQVQKPTGIATVPIRVVHHHCEGDEECPSGDYCGADGDCHEPCTDDANCPTGEVCEGGTCQEPPPPCTSDSDCPDPGDACIGGYCLPPCPPAGDGCGVDDVGCAPSPCHGGDGDTPPCVRDDQCGDGDVCEGGVCQPPTTPCDVSCPEGDVCQGGTCIPPTAPCTTDSDCAGGEACVGGTCHPGQPPCEGSDCPSCQFDEDCSGGQVCVGGQCHTANPPVPCSTDPDCPSGQTCQGGYCDVPEPCNSDGDCPSGTVCDGTVDLCVPPHPPVPCQGTGDCPSGDTCDGGYCTPPGTPCRNDKQCSSGDTCQGGTCQPPEPPCTGDSDCPAGSTCDPVVDLCIPPHPPIPCTVTTDCPGGDQCTGGVCQPDQPCTGDGDCPGGDVCQDPGSGSGPVVDLCLPGQPPVPCTVSTDCPADTCGLDDVGCYPVCYGGYCQPGSGGSCTQDSDCPGGDACTGGSCVPVGSPVPCQGQYDCTSGDTCQSGYCAPGGPVTECTTDSDCWGADDVGTATCIGGVCENPVVDLVHCSSDGDCAPGTTCQNGGCVRVVGACEVNSDCDSGQSCLSGWCGTACTDAGACAAGQTCAMGRCAASCQSYADCGESETCYQGGCVPTYAFVGAEGGDQSLWDVDAPGQPPVAGGCDVGGGSGLDLALALFALLLGLGLVRPRRDRGVTGGGAL